MGVTACRQTYLVVLVRYLNFLRGTPLSIWGWAVTGGVLWISTLFVFAGRCGYFFYNFFSTFFAVTAKWWR